MYELIEQLKNKHWLWQGSETQTTSDYRSTGYPELDTHLCGGFPTHGVVEIQSPIGIGELRLLLPYLQQHNDRLTVLINPPGNVHSEALQHAGLMLSQVLVLTPRSAKEALWAAEQCLKSGACSQVLLWQEELEVHQARRLQVASETGESLNFLFRPQQQHLFSLPVTLSLQLAADSDGLQVTIAKRRGGWSSEPFVVNFRQRWNSLTKPLTSPVVVPFPIQKQG